jgi:ABC-type antimicrobial peptide transport system permease subunit
MGTAGVGATVGQVIGVGDLRDHLVDLELALTIKEPPGCSPMTLMAIFAGVAAVLALVGIQSVVARAVTERRHEIGLRMALAATAGDVLRWITRRTMAPVVVGLVVGLGVALALSRLLESQLVNLSTHDPATVAAAAGGLAVAALLAVLVPARQATRVDQIEVLRRWSALRRGPIRRRTLNASARFGIDNSVSRRRALARRPARVDTLHQRVRCPGSGV